MNKIYLIAVFALFSGMAFAGDSATTESKKTETTRKPASSLPPANVTVYSVEGSDQTHAEKWVDYTTKMVCYVAGYEGTAISCTKVENLVKPTR
ncbi:MAG: hypothetical protein H7301_13855 [Cryobacterium sp.]|nr:hypothetical protein [Oligoflexia bacterium]